MNIGPGQRFLCFFIDDLPLIIDVWAEARQKKVKSESRNKQILGRMPLVLDEIVGEF